MPITQTTFAMAVMTQAATASSRSRIYLVFQSQNDAFYAHCVIRMLRQFITDYMQCILASLLAVFLSSGLRYSNYALNMT